ncbi:MAG TPA: hypothetical protein VLY23_04220 [Candidatus Acidoferrum sp.]|nr:hypothetical protein [Candidatus Acidoferrum sp.]
MHFAMTNRKGKQKRALKRGQRVVLKVLPPGLIDGLPEEDQQAISAVVGKPTIFERYERNGTAKLEFMANDETMHMIWVEPKYIRVWRPSSIRRHLWKQRGTGFKDRLKTGRRKKLDRGQRVILQPLPKEVIEFLPAADQQIVSEVVGRPIVFFIRYGRDGSAELEFVGSDNTAHLIYVDPRFVKTW